MVAMLIKSALFAIYRPTHILQLDLGLIEVVGQKGIIRTSVRTPRTRGIMVDEIE